MAALGPVPADGPARVDWLTRAGTVAGHREATGWEHPDQPIGTMPGLAATERRASHVAAWHALGQPEAGIPASAMTDGQLRIRVRAADAEKAWAPPHADDALRAAEIAAETARHNAALAYAAAEHATRTGDHGTASTHLAAAARHDADHHLRAAALEPLTLTVTARSAWAAATAVTLDEGTRATTELTRRGLTPGTEPDRTTTPHWLTTHHPDLTHEAGATVEDAETTTAQDTSEDAAERAANRARALTAARHHNPDVEDQGHAHVEPADELPEPVNELPDPIEESAVDDPEAALDPRSPEVVSPDVVADAPENGWGHNRSPAAAYDVVPVTATLDDLRATAAIAAVALDRAAERAAQDRPTDTADLDDTHTTGTGAGVDRHDTAGDE